MVDVALLSPMEGVGSPIAHSSRPTILTYRSPLLEHARKFMALPLYITGWRTEAETLLVPIMEDVVFRKGRQHIPTSVRVQLLNAADIQLYNATITFKARLRGLR
jgi:seipin